MLRPDLGSVEHLQQPQRHATGPRAPLGVLDERLEIVLGLRHRLGGDPAAVDPLERRPRLIELGGQRGQLGARCLCRRVVGHERGPRVPFGQSG